MAYAPASVPPLELPIPASRRLRHSFGRWRTYMSVRDELTRLTDRDLADIGIHRSNIPEIARRAAGMR